MQANAEHQKDHAKLGQLARQRAIGDVARGERTDEYSRDKITCDWRDAEPLSDRSEDEGRDKPGDTCPDQRGMMGHGDELKIEAIGASPVVTNRTFERFA